MKLSYLRPVPSLAIRAFVSPQQRRYSKLSSALSTPASRSFEQLRSQQTMASPTKVHLSTTDVGVVTFKPQDEDTAKVASSLLQKNHDDFNLFFNDDGFHNHIVHHILSLYGVGAPASAIESQFKHNSGYQKPHMAVNQSHVQNMADPDKFMKYLGKMQYTGDFLEFFRKELEAKGVEKVLQDYVFAGDERADAMFGRLYAGFLHPIIHLGFGLEFSQPAIVCEALAQVAVHQNWLTPFLIDAEKAAKSAGPSQKTLPELLEEIRQDEKLSLAAHWEDGNKVRDGIMKRAPEEAIKYVSQWTVDRDDLNRKTAEMINSAIYYTAGAQHPPKQVKFDFYFMHCVNASIFWTSFNQLSWLSLENKIRLLEWKGRLDLVMYASRRSPKLLLEEITGYVPKDLEVGGGEWKGIFRRMFELDDDGHAIKLARAVCHGEEVCRQYEDEDWCRIKSFMWLKIGNMIIDSVEDDGAHWVRSAGFDEAWKEYKDRPRQVHI